MQTLLPLPDYRENARVIDPKRLGNQAYREGLTLIRGGWANHVAARMWQGHFFSLGQYCLALFEELTERGHHYPARIKDIEVEMVKHPDTGPPVWLSDEAFHASHRSSLLRKDPEYYGQFGWEEPYDLPLVWPKNGDTLELTREPQLTPNDYKWLERNNLL